MKGELNVSDGGTMPLAEMPEHLGFRRIHVILCIVCFLGNMVAGCIPGCIPYIGGAVMNEYSITEGQMGLMTSGSSAGSVVGVFLFGWLADLLGRRISLAICAFMTCAFAFPFMLLPVGTAYWANVALHAVLGIPFGGLSTILTPYCLEFFSDSRRGYAATLISLGFPTGSIFCIQIVDSFKVDGELSPEGWRNAIAAGALVPGCIFLVSMAFIVESPRWLYSTGQRSAGEKVLERLYAPRTPPTIAELPEEFRDPPMKLVGDLFKPSMRSLTVLACCLYISTACASYAGWTHAPNLLKEIGGAPIGNMFFVYTEVAGVVGAFICAAMLDPVGRRPTLLLGYILGLTGYGLLLTPVASPETVGWIWLLVGLVQGIMWPALNTFLTEIFPTKLRGTGTGLAALFGRFANIIAPWAVGALFQVDVYYALALLMSFYGGGIALTFLMKETTGVALADAVEVDEAAQSLS